VVARGWVVVSERVTDAPFRLPLAIDLVAVWLFAATGALEARRKRYDVVGAGVLALVAGLGGGFLRDALLMQGGPAAALRDGRFLMAVLVGTATGIWFAGHLLRLRLAVLLADAVALALYGVYGAQMALLAGLPFFSAALVGTVNAVGGGLLRDVLAREVPLVFKPGQLYALAALAGSAAFLLLDAQLGLPTPVAATVGVLVTLALRIGSIRLGWRTGAIPDEPAEGP
jgi:uncharacterized membrane protein YeiH